MLLLIRPEVGMEWGGAMTTSTLKNATELFVVSSDFYVSCDGRVKAFGKLINTKFFKKKPRRLFLSVCNNKQNLVL